LRHVWVLLEVNKTLVVEVSKPLPFNWNGPIKKRVEKPELPDDISSVEYDNEDDSAPNTSRGLLIEPEASVIIENRD